MPSTHLSLHYHVVFSTKDRQPLIAEEWRGRLFEYIGGLIRAAEGIPEAVGGAVDHIHMLIGLRAIETSFCRSYQGLRPWLISGVPSERSPFGHRSVSFTHGYSCCSPSAIPGLNGFPLSVLRISNFGLS